MVRGGGPPTHQVKNLYRQHDTLTYYVYILTNRPNGTLYAGVTNDIIRRVTEHRANIGSKFTTKYGIHRLVYFEAFEQIESAIHREKRIKTWNRAWKVRMILQTNPEWRDLFDDLQLEF
jgi:putative endonuclease